MKPDLVAEFTRRLRKARRRLFLTVARTDEELATLEAYQPGTPAEEADRETAASLLARLEGRERHELDEIGEAQARFAAGAFGVCDTCGQPIPLTRLRAMPTARYCVPCQVKRGT